MKLRPYQEDAVRHTFDYINKGGRAGILALITAAGKSVIIAEILKRILLKKPHVKMMMLTHVKELIEQNEKRLKAVWPAAPVGIYSSGIGKKQLGFPITYAGIQSVYRHAKRFGKINLLLIDECFSADTEILTSKGFVRFDNLDDKDSVAQYNAFTKKVSFVEPTRLVKKKPTSDIHHLHGERSCDLLVTANHDLLVERNGMPVKVKVSDLKHNSYSKIPNSGFASGDDEVLTSWEKLHIAFHDDGNLHKVNSDGSAILAFAFSKDRKKNEFLSLMGEGGFKWKLNDIRVSENPNVKDRSRYFVYLPASFDFRNKSIETVFDISSMSLQKAKAIIEYMNCWDGHVCGKDGGVYLYTNTNEKACDTYQIIASLSGYSTYVRKVIDTRSDSFNPVYRLFISKNKDGYTTQTLTNQVVQSAETYSDYVYCATVPDGNIIVRRNKKISVVGNCHLVSAEDESMYLSFINALKEANPDLVVLGLTATPYRLGMGYLTEGPIFKDIFFDNTKMDAFVQMIDDGYVSDLISVDMDNKFDLSAVKVTKGDFQEKSLDENINRDEITKAIIEESLPHIAKRKKGLVFCVSMSHAENMSMRFNEVGVKSTFVHSELSKEEREKRLKDFDKGLYKVICNVGVLTTGFDQPDIDFLIIARPSQSTSLHVQMLGRGMRIAPEKLNCVVLDFAGNTMRLGPVNDPVIPQPKGKGVGEAPVKLCKTCSTINHASARVCKVCGSPFPEPEVKITPKLETVDVIRRKDIPIINDEDVQAVLFNMYTTVEGLKKVKVTVVIGMSKYIDLFLTFDPSLGRQYKDTMELIKKLKFSTKTPTLENADDALEFMKTYLIKPQKVKVWHNKPVPGKAKRRKQILSYLYEDK